MRYSTLLCALCVMTGLFGCDGDEQVTSTGGAEAGMNAGVQQGGTPGGAQAGMTAGATGGMTAGMTAGVTGGMTAGVDVGGVEAGVAVSGTEAGVMGGTDAGVTGGTEAGIPLSALVDETAVATCDALFRCCTEQNVLDFFAPIVNNPRYEEIVDMIPPNVNVDAASCPDLMRVILDVAPIGSWVRAVERGEVSYDGEAAQACRDTLNSASCGDDVLSALYDGTCLSYTAPLGGDEQRKMFSRARATGESCGPIYDGVGGVFYGTCDPHVAFCCVRNERGDCLPASSEDTVGECVAVSAVGEACSAFPAQLCATGFECNVDGVCEALNTTPLAVGQACTENFSALGECVDSYCDYGNTDTCVAFLPDGAECTFHYECEGGSCIEGTCQVNTYCVGQ